MWWLRKLISKFSPQLFWWLYSRDFYADPWQHGIYEEHLDLLRFVRKYKPKNILEIGCGFGRNLEYLISGGVPVKSLTGTDFTGRLLQLAKSKLKNVSLIRADASKQPFPDASFNLAFTHGLLMHIPPAKINQAFSEIIRVSKKYILIYELVNFTNQYTFDHDYVKLAKDYNLKVKFKFIDKRDLIWLHLEK